MKRVLIALAVALVFGCSGDEGAECEPVDHDGTSYCVYQGAITETGYTCPAEQPNLYHDMATELAVCSDQDEPPPFDELSDVLEEPPSSNDPNLMTGPTEAEQCIEDHEDGSMLSDLDSGECYYNANGPCEQVDLEADVRAACNDAGDEGCDDPFITREAALCITRAGGLEAGEWPETARLVYNEEQGPVWVVSVLRDIAEDMSEGGGEFWMVDARTGEIVEDEGGFGWIN